MRWLVVFTILVFSQPVLADVFQTLGGRKSKAGMMYDCNFCDALEMPGSCRKTFSSAIMTRTKVSKKKELFGFFSPTFGKRRGQPLGLIGEGKMSSEGDWDVPNLEGRTRRGPNVIAMQFLPGDSVLIVFDQSQNGIGIHAGQCTNRKIGE